jgi:hypothetical protein
MDEAFAQTARFHAQALDAKMAMPFNSNNQGYLPYRGNTTRMNAVDGIKKPNSEVVPSASPNNTIRKSLQPASVSTSCWTQDLFPSRTSSSRIARLTLDLATSAISVME